MVVLKNFNVVIYYERKKDITESLNQHYQRVYMAHMNLCMPNAKNVLYSLDDYWIIFENII